MSIAALIRTMAAAGASPEAIAIAVEAIEGVEAKLAAQRAAARDRKRKQRAGQSQDGHVTVTGQSQDNPPEVRPLSPQTPLSPTPTLPEVTTRAKRCDDTPDFVRFWAAYPNKSAKDNARKAFATARKRCDLETMLAAIEAQRTWEQWQRGFVPHAASWLNAGRWQDEPPPTPVIPLKPAYPNVPGPDHKRTAREANLARAFAGVEAASRFRAER